VHQRTTRFGPDYGDEDGMSEYSPNAVWQSKYGSGGYEHVDWGNPSTYTWVQYLILSLAAIGLLAICVAIGGVFWWKTKKKGNYHFGDEGSPKTRGRRESNSDISTPLAGDQEGDHDIDDQNGRSTQTNGGMGRSKKWLIGSPKMGKMKMVPSASVDPYDDGIDMGVEMESVPATSMSVTSPMVEVNVSMDELAARQHGGNGIPPPRSRPRPPPVPQRALHEMGVTNP